MVPISRTDARKAGLSRFFTGKPCLHGHLAERFVCNARCVACQALSTSQWRKDHLEKCTATRRAWAEANRTRSREVKRKWNQQNPEGQKARSRKWYEANKEKSFAAHSRWAERNPEKVAAAAARRRAKVRQAMPNWADQDAILSFYREAQRLTQSTGTEHHVDHIVPLQSERVCGLHIAPNLQVLPQSINQSKSNRFWPDS